MTVAVRVIPRSPRSAITGTRGGAIVIRLAAPPVEGAANEALIELLARALGRPRRDVVIVSGHTSRDKRVSVDGLSDAEVSARLSVFLDAGR